MELREVMRTAATVRDFLPDPVPDEDLYEIIDVARFASSGGNRQGWRVILVKDPATRVKVRDLYAAGWREYSAYVRNGQVPFNARDHGPGRPYTVDLEEAGRTPAPSAFVEHLDEVPAMLVVTAELASLATVDVGLDRLSIVGGASVYTFVHNILLAARDMGYGGVLTTILTRREPEAKTVLAIPDDVAIASLVALGRPAKQVTRLRRAPVEELVSIDTYGGPPLTRS